MNVFKWCGEKIKDAEAGKRDMDGRMRFKKYARDIQKKKGSAGNERVSLLHKNDVYSIGFFYPPYSEVELSRSQEKKMDEFAKFVRGHEEHYAKHLQLYTDMIRTFIRMNPYDGFITLVCVPAAMTYNADRSAVKRVVKDIAAKQPFHNTICFDGSEILKRKRNLVRRSGSRLSAEEVKDTLEVTRSLNGENVIVLDDIMRSGNTSQACVEKLREAGAENVSVLCLYMMRNQ